jgi:hypothetical protein
VLGHFLTAACGEKMTGVAFYSEHSRTGPTLGSLFEDERLASRQMTGGWLDIYPWEKGFSSD